MKKICVFVLLVFGLVVMGCPTLDNDDNKEVDDDRVVEEKYRGKFIRWIGTPLSYNPEFYDYLEIKEKSIERCHYHYGEISESAPAERAWTVSDKLYYKYKDNSMKKGEERFFGTFHNL